MYQSLFELVKSKQIFLFFILKHRIPSTQTSYSHVPYIFLGGEIPCPFLKIKFPLNGGMWGKKSPQEFSILHAIQFQSNSFFCIAKFSQGVGKLLLLHTHTRTHTYTHTHKENQFFSSNISMVKIQWEIFHLKKNHFLSYTFIIKENT